MERTARRGTIRVATSHRTEEVSNCLATCLIDSRRSNGVGTSGLTDPRQDMASACTCIGSFLHT